MGFGMTTDMDHGETMKTDGELVRDALANDSDAWEELVCAPSPRPTRPGGQAFTGTEASKLPFQ